MKPKVSVIIPVYNAEDYVGQCIESLRNQTLQDIEIICVDDDSKDSSPEIIKQFCIEDPRVKGYFFTESRSAMGARSQGVAMAQGEYILFLDSDDYLEPDACEALYQKITEENVDILHFTSKIENCADLPEKRIEMNEKLLEPFRGRLQGDEIFTACFSEKKYGFTLWNKLFRASLCRQAFSCISSGYLPKAQDLYTYFAIAFFAESYLGWKSQPYHHYCFGRGVTGSRMNLGNFERYCRQADIIQALKKFCKEQKIDNEQTQVIIDGYEKQWQKECVNLWSSNFSSKDSSKAAEILFQYWDSRKIIQVIAEKYWYSRDIVADKIGKIPGTALKDKKVNTAAIYYHHLTIGGVQKVIILLVPILQKLGYRVVLVIDKELTENCFRIPKGVECVNILDYQKTNRNNYDERMENWQQIIEKYQIDMVLYHAWVSPLLLWDMLYLKSHDIPVVVHTHSVFTYSLNNLRKEFSECPKILALADGIVTLSRVDQLFWRVYNPHVWHLPNPVEESLIHVPVSSGKKPVITWIGRFSNEKQPWEALNIMEQVVKQCPDAVLYMIGDSSQSHVLDNYRKNAEKKGIENNVQFLGYQENVSSFLAESSVNIITSTYEGYSMVLLEAQAHGVPSVIYSMPYLDLAREECGVISVGMNDRRGAADEIIQLLNNPEFWQEKHQQACRSFQNLLQYDFASAWKEVISGQAPAGGLDEDAAEMVRTISSHYLAGWKKMNHPPSAAGT